MQTINLNACAVINKHQLEHQMLQYGVNPWSYKDDNPREFVIKIEQQEKALREHFGLS